jgi:hypothetical protein
MLEDLAMSQSPFPLSQPPLPDRDPVHSDRFAEALRRAQAEFREMPGLKLTEAQAARLLSFDSALCHQVLAALVDQHFLTRTRDSFQRAS